MNKQDLLAVNAARILGTDMIKRANSGHPGSVLGAAPLAYTLFERELEFSPNDPNWLNRDRFVMSAGHGSALLYALLYLNGFDLTMNDLKDFRRLGSKTPGHPEVQTTPGVDASTGPLGQGVAMAVGLAMAERHLAAVYNRPGYPVINHYTYALCGDGDLMEGVAKEAIDLAGHYQLGKLIVLYDSNDVTLDGPRADSASDHCQGVMEAAGWDYHLVSDGDHDLDGIEAAIEAAKEDKRPSIIEVKTTLGYASPLAGDHRSHGAPLSEEATAALRDKLGWTWAPFTCPSAVYKTYREAVAKKKPAYQSWQAMMAGYQTDYPAEYRELTGTRLETTGLTSPAEPGEWVATRAASEGVMQQVAAVNPHFWGGSADLASPTRTSIHDAGRFTAQTPGGRNIAFGVREFGMAACVNGINLHGGTRAYVATFLTFTDYMRSAIRQAALMGVPSIFIASHDSVAVGEDGPSHQPVEHLAAFRAMPNLNVIRPADANETVAAWRTMLTTTDRPSLLVTSRQELPVMAETRGALVDHGAYVLADAPASQLDAIIMASGSEVHLALAAQQRLLKRGLAVRVVSVPCMELFLNQSRSYKESVLPPEVDNRVAVEMAATQPWYRFVGKHGRVIGVDRFGASGVAKDLQSRFNVTTRAIEDQVLDLLGNEVLV